MFVATALASPRMSRLARQSFAAMTRQERARVMAIGGLSQTTGFWGFIYNFNINTAGLVIVGMFILTWLAALLIWRFGRIEERWTARLQPAPAGSDQP